VAKFGGHGLRHLASKLANVIRQGGREGVLYEKHCTGFCEIEITKIAFYPFVKFS